MAPHSIVGCACPATRTTWCSSPSWARVRSLARCSCRNIVSRSLLTLRGDAGANDPVFASRKGGRLTARAVHGITLGHANVTTTSGYLHARPGSSSGLERGRWGSTPSRAASVRVKPSIIWVRVIVVPRPNPQHAGSEDDQCDDYNCFQHDQYSPHHRLVA